MPLIRDAIRYVKRIEEFMTSVIGKYIHKYFLLNHPFFKTSADKHLKWIPFATVFLGDLFGVKTKSGWKEQVLIAGAAEAIRYAIADNLKKLTHEHRPAPYLGNHSFPSGHAASSFAGAEFMHIEFKRSLPFLSSFGYVGATATAAIRLMKNRHWLRDVVAGAAIGVLSVRLAYFLVNKLTRSNEKNFEKINPETFEESINSGTSAC
jgi:membrane-associated phospholipid phosphatase